MIDRTGIFDAQWARHAEASADGLVIVKGQASALPVQIVRTDTGVTPGWHAISSDGEEGPRWIITKTVTIGGQPICWSIPVETVKGTTVDVKLTPRNRFDLLDAFESVLEGKSPAKP